MAKVKIYSTHECGTCKALKGWLDEQGVAYESVFVDDGDAQMQEMMSVSEGHVGVPFSVIEGADGGQQKIAGFDRTKFKQVLGSV